MPEEQYPMRASQKPGSEHHIGPPIQNGFQQYSVVCGIVFKISILNDDDLPSGFGKSGPQCCAFTFIVVMVKDLEIFPAFKFFQDIPCSVCGEIIDKDDFFLIVHSFDSRNQGTKCITFVINRNDDGKFNQVKVRTRCK